jgi:glycosyltransferase involved in cell wall biosynthesis
VQVEAPADPNAALQAAAEALAPDARLLLRVGTTGDTAAIVDAVGRLQSARRPAMIAWSAIAPAAEDGALAFLDALGYVNVALSMIDGEASLDAIEAPDRVTAVVSLTPDMLAWMEGEAAEAAAASLAMVAPTPSAPLQVSIALSRPSTAPRPLDRTMVATEKVGIDWELRADTGWGVYGTNLALELERSGSLRPALFAADTTDLAPVTRFRLDRALREGAERAAAMAGAAAPAPFEGLMLRALGNNMAHGTLWDRVTARRNVGVIFFEDVAFDAAALARAGALDLIVAGSHWNEEVLRAAGLTNVTTVLQGIDPTIFHPAPRSGHLSGRFVVFSGGKLEYRKGQDLVVAAFRAFRQRHPEALLLTAWHNNWPQLIADLELAGHVQGTPRLDGARLAIPEWLAANGIPADAVLDVGRTPNAMMGQVVREADVALFPNRCEGGTNLVAMECMAAGIPTIVSDNSGHRDLVATGGAFALTRQRPVRRPTRFYSSAAGWGESDVEEMVESLEAVYAARAEVAATTQRGIDALRAMTWQSQVQQLMHALSPLLK